MHALSWWTTVRTDQCTAACETHWTGHLSRRRRAQLMFDVQGHWQCATETGTIYDDVFTGSTRRRHGLTWAGVWWPLTRTGVTLHWLVQPTIVYVRSSRRVSEWVDTGQALQCWYHYDFDSTRYNEHSGPFCTHSLAHHWCNCHPPISIPGSQCNALHDRCTAGNVRQREPQMVCTASDINQTQTQPWQYASSTRETCVHAWYRNIVRYVVATISYARWIRDWYHDIV